ncbi:MAG: prepilin-type N-terminal cleavage/methylation domain-containing protein [Planctomycetota bacterium]
MRIRTPQNVNARGFSFIELMIVIAMLAILAAIVYPKFVNATDDARLSATKAQLRTVRAAIERYKSDHGVDPTMTNWNALVTNDYLKIDAANPSNGLTAISGSAGANIGWVWRQKSVSDTSMDIFATSVNPAVEFTE